MNFLRVFAAALLPLACARAAETTNLLALKRPLVITPAAQRLNASPFFKTTINDFDRCLWHRLTGNFVEPHLSPKTDFGVFMCVPEIGAIRYRIWVYLDAPARHAIDLGTNRLVVIVDGHPVINTQPVPGVTAFETRGAGRSLSVTESALYHASEDVIRAIASARRVQFRVEGGLGTLQRSLDSTNIGRFKVFAAAFLPPR